MKKSVVFNYLRVAMVALMIAAFTAGCGDPVPEESPEEVSKMPSKEGARKKQ